MQKRLIAIIGVASALALSQYAHANAPPEKVVAQAPQKEVATMLHPADALVKSSTQTLASEPIVVTSNSVTTFPTGLATHDRLVAYVAREVDGTVDTARASTEYADTQATTFLARTVSSENADTPVKSLATLATNA